jgi:hypothetical protein
MNYHGKAADAANKILALFEEPDKLPAVVAPIFAQSKDEIPCRNWSWRNQILTAIAGTHDARGYRQWQDAGRYVKEGSKAFYILAPCMKKVRDNATGEEGMRLVGFKATPVFRFEDTDGKALPDAMTDYEWVKSLPFLEVARAWGIALTVYNGTPGRGHGWYSPTGDQIGLGVENPATFLHELAHAADHRNGKLTERGQHWRAETVAEFSGAVLCRLAGLEQQADLGGAFRYLEKYADTAGKSVCACCMEVLDRICETVALILETAAKAQADSAECAEAEADAA